MSSILYMIQVYPSGLTNESRMSRTSKAFLKYAPHAKVLWIGINDGKLPETEVISNHLIIWRLKISLSPYKIPLIGRFFVLFSWFKEIVRKIKEEKIEKIVAIQSNSVFDLPLAYYLTRKFNCNLFYDAHELETERNGLTGIHKRIDKFIENRFIRKAAHVFVVSESIKKWYNAIYPGVPITLIKNIPKYQRLSLSSNNYLRSYFKIPDENLLFLYVGTFIKGRGIEIRSQIVIG